jgi:MoxR-like ATPase
VSSKENSKATPQRNALNAFRALRAELDHRLIARTELIDRMTIALITGGHLLIEGAPGLAKTRAVKLFAALVDASFVRIQATPDLLPSDLTGTTVFRPERGAFEFIEGPLFHNVVLVDEINRAPPKVQSALLEAMGEGQITHAGETRRLHDLFMVAATQNPIEHEGTYPLPEAQLDRFLFFVDVPMPDVLGERAILDLALSERLDADIMSPMRA